MTPPEAGLDGETPGVAPVLTQGRTRLVRVCMRLAVSGTTRYDDAHMRRMERVTATLREDDVRELKARVMYEEADSRSEALRQLIDERYAVVDELEELRTRYEARGDRVEDLKERLAARDRRVDDLEEQLRERSRVEDKIDDLPDQLRAGMASYEARRRRLLDEASLVERLKWRVTGVPVDRVDELEE